MSILLNNVRLSFPSLFKATSFESEDPKFKGTFILPKDHPDVAKLKAEMKKVMLAKWGEKPSGLKLFLRDGAEKELDGFGNTMYFFNANNAKRPGVYDRDQTPLMQEDGRPYAGCYVNARISVWAQDNKFGKRINAELNGVQFYADGDAFGGGGPASSADDFPELEPSEGMDVPADEAGYFDDDLLG